MHAATQCRFTPDRSSFGLSISSDGRRAGHTAANFDHHWAIVDTPVRIFRVRIIRNPLHGGLLVGLTLPSAPLRNLHQEREEKRLSRQASKSAADMQRPQKLLQAHASMSTTTVPTVTVNGESQSPAQRTHLPLNLQSNVASTGTRISSDRNEAANDDDEDEEEGERFPAKSMSSAEERFNATSFMLEMRSGALFERGKWGPSQSLGHNVLEGALVCVEKNYSSKAIRFVIRNASRPDHRIGARRQSAQGTGVDVGLIVQQQPHSASIGARPSQQYTTAGVKIRRNTVLKEQEGLTGVLYDWRPTGLNAEQFDSLIGVVMMYINGDEVQIEDEE